MSELARRLESLSPEKRELLLQSLLKKSGKAADASPGGAASESDDDRIVPRDRSMPPPLSFGQERLWILDQFDPGNSAYNVYQAFEIAGPLELPVLAAAVREIIRRHECLRTTFAVGAPPARDPVQVVRSDLRLDLPLIDFESISSAALQLGEVRKTARRVALRPYDLRTGPLVRATVIRLSARRHVVILATHHIVSDDWSSDVFLGELGVLYHSFARGAPSPLPELAVQYADYAVWQRARLRGARLDRLLEFWTERLGDAPRVLELPTDRPRPAAQTFQGGWVSIEWPSELVDEIRVLARRSGATLYMAVLAAWKALLAQYAGVRDVVVGAPIAGQSRLELEGLIGFFINTLALRTDLSGNPSFQELVGRVRETTHTAFAHQEMPFEKLVEELQPERDPSRTPLVQVVFNLLGATGGGQQLGALRVTPLALEIPLVMFDLILTLRERAGSLTGRLEFASALFDRASMARMAGHLEELVRDVAARPERRLGSLCVLSPAERAQMLSEWNDTEAPAEKRPLIHELFAAQARKRPGAVAVVFADTHWTYLELDRRSNRLARQLRDLGVGRGHRVAVLLERSAEMVLALLATLKSGAAYVPLESRFPEKRMAWILRNMEIGVVLTSNARLETARALSSEAPGLSSVVCLDRAPAAEQDGGTNVVGWRELGRQSERALSGRGCLDDLAYVIFTSGSTGLPKGVMVRHRPVVNLIDWANRRFALGGSDRVLFITSLGFDLSVFDVFGMLAVGGSIRVASEEEASDPAMLARILLDEPISFWDSAPVALTQLVPFLAASPPRTEPLLRLVFLSGDWIPLNLPDQIRASFPKAQVVALGGATEATVWSNYHPVEAIDRGWVSIPYGRPILNARYYVLNEHLKPVPVGVPGDLYIGGGCLASGYAAAPVQTAWHFLPDHISGAPGAVMYRTGDRSRFRHSGWIEFLGRVDHQVKVRGFRIELGEIEAVLRTHPAVRQGVVLAREARRWEKRLVAYVVCRSPTSVRELREHLRDRLPDYMVPPVVVFLDQLPVTANGKLDRAALPAPDEVESAEPEVAGAPPRDPVEELVAAIWCEILGVARVSRDDSFFELGGQSLTATRVVIRLREVFRVEVPLRAFFEHPTVAELAAVVAREAGSAAALPPIERVARDRELELSFAQERLWFLYQLDPSSPAYNIPVATRLRGRLDLPVFTAAWNEVVARHESLRTRFTVTGGTARQEIEPPKPLAWPIVDLGRLTALRTRGEVERLARSEAGRPFDLAAGPLLRGRLLTLGDDDWAVLLVMHHIVSDAWSMAILVEEIIALYQAFLHRRPSPLPELGIQYADFAHWQRRWLEGEVLEAELAYWREQLGDGPAVLELPTDHPRPREQTFQGSNAGALLPAALLERLTALSSSHAVTLFMSLLAVFQAFLSRWTGQTDVSVGSPIAGRNHVETERLIGLFVNTLVLRTDLGGRPTFRELLGRVREVTLGAYSHQNVPFEKLVDEVQPDRDMSRTPLFQVMFVLQNAPAGAPDAAELASESISFQGGTAKFDLTLSVEEGAQGLVLDAEYNLNLFDPTTIERLLRHYQELLESAAVDPEAAAEGVSLLGRWEHHQMLSEWNDSAVSYQMEKTLSRSIEAQVERSPEAVALDFEGRQLTYAALNVGANQLARYLRRHGIGRGALVGICAERSLEMVQGLLGILKAGGGYVPLDPDFPGERLAFMLEDALGSSESPVLLTSKSLEGRSEIFDVLGTVAGAFPSRLRVVLLDAVGAEITAESDANPTIGASSDDLAYAIYTSGSTGRPKGVINHHRGIVNRLLWMQQAFGLTGDDRVLQKTPFSFDVSVWEFFWPLMVGSRLVIARPEGHRDASYLVRLVRDARVTTLHFVPSMLRVFVDEDGLDTLRSVRRVICSGEALAPELAERFHARLGREGSELHNLYGPTEAAVDVTWWACRGEERRVPIGRPIANTTTRILDRGSSPVPIGQAGELHLGGVQLAWGYLGRPGLTAERFVPDPFGGGRLYRTGDLARYLADGNVEFIGRTDYQVKIRGHRIELGEIEELLGRHPAVREAVVVDREDRPGERRLVAYFVIQAGSEAKLPEIRSFLGERLPDYMVPSAFVELERLPKTTSGKLDRRSLPSPQRQPIKSHTAPVSPAEEIMADIWSSVLGIDAIGVTENFFTLGGDSLLAVRVVSRVREIFQVDLQLAAIFANPTIAQLVNAVSSGGREVSRWIDRASRGERLPLSFAQQRLWFLHQLDSRSAVYHIPAAVRLDGVLDVPALEATLSEIVRRHEVLRTHFTTVDGEPTQVIEAPRPFRLPVVDLRRLRDEEELRGLIGAFSGWPFDLARGPVLRGLLAKEGEHRHVMILTLHHIASDGWSTGVLLREVHRLYDAFSRRRPPSLPELPVQYADFAVWQRRWITGEVLQKQVTYWRRQLLGSEPAAGPPVLELPTDRPRPAIQTFHGGGCAVPLTADRVEGLRRVSLSTGTTLFMAALAVFDVLLHRLSGQADIAVGVPIAGRDHLQTEDLIGFFVNTLVMRVDLGGDPLFAALLRRVREVTLGAYAHQDLPFETLVNELKMDRDMSRSPLFQVLFALDNTLGHTAVDPLRLSEGLSLEPLEISTGTAKFDLAVVVLPSPPGMVVTFEYNSDLYDGTTVARMATQFKELLRGVAGQASCRLSELSMMSAAERGQVLREWNDTAKACPQLPLVHELFAAEARRRPMARAVVSTSGTLSYGELEARANRLAHHLCSLGVGPEVSVALLTGRTLARSVAILAVLKAGGAYVSLDPTYPKERLAFLVDDARAPVLLTEEVYVEALPEVRTTVLFLDRDWPSIRGEEDAAPVVSVTPDNLAYVVYTSGSTGKPKGVEIPHAGLMNMTRWHRDLYGVTENDRGTQVASPAFDASIWEFWPYLTAGASSHIPDDETRFSSLAMIRWWGEQGITLAYLPTPLAEGVLEEKIPSDLDLVTRALIIGGDRLHRGPDPEVGFRLMNHYGPAEYSIVTTVVEVPPMGREPSALPTIGRAIDNTQMYGVDGRLHPLPIGVPGELYIGGVGLARSYLGRPGLTGEKFVPDPFGGAPGSRLYRTGDQVRFLADGDLYFLGRFDHQIKLRGLRIELGEIEAALGEHPEVREGVVLVREDQPGEKRLVAYLVATEASTPPAAGALRSFLEDRLPRYMVPAVLVTVPSLPLTANGKVDRRALARQPLPETAADRRLVEPDTPLESRIAEIWADLLGLEQVGVEDNFFDLGGHSMLMARLQHRLREDLELELTMIELFQLPTVRAIAARAESDGSAAERPVIATRTAKRGLPEGHPGSASRGVAIIGMAGRFPGARNVDEFWRNLCEGVESVVRFTAEELIEAGEDPDVVKLENFVPAAGKLEGADLFDAGFFGLSPRDAEVLDPQQRIFLECAWQALEDAGYGRKEDRGAVGVFAGSNISTYLVNLHSHPDLLASVGAQLVLISNDKDHLATRTSYMLDLNGPSVSVQTACSTSMVGVHLACQALLHGECDMALAGGVGIAAQQVSGYLYEEGGVQSPDGHCRAFDAAGRGTVSGNGAGVVVLKRVEQALADGDSIYAVVRGTAINNDGSDKVGYTAPRIDGQAEVIAEAQEMAGVNPESVGYVEAHGSGTRLGDPIEIAALTAAFRSRSQGESVCAVGSVKTNIGHLDSAAGVAGLIKATLAVERGQVPPSLHFENPNPEIDFASSPFYVSTELHDWPIRGIRRAGVSSFGIGGTNVHAVLEEAPAGPAAAPARPWQLLLLSARTDTASETARENLVSRLGAEPELELADVAYTLQVGRTAFASRQAVVCRDREDALRALAGGDQSRLLRGAAWQNRPAIAFLFSGLGDHYVRMGLGLYRSESEFREIVDHSARLLESELGCDIREVLFGEDDGDEEATEASTASSSGAQIDLKAMLRSDPRRERLHQTKLAQPVLFVLEYALARLWMSWGIVPQAMIGYSLGEYVAACVSGVLSYEDALTLVARRARMIQDLPGGAMLAVSLSEQETRSYLGAGLSLAAINSPTLCVVAGSEEAVAELEERLLRDGHLGRRLPTTHAFHSHMMEPIAGDLFELVRSFDLKAPRIPYVSNVSGTWITDDQATDPGYWVRHLLGTVRFADGIGELWRLPGRILLELGPGQALGSLALQHPEGDVSGERMVLASLPSRYGRQEDPAFLLSSLGRLWLAGVEVDWAGFHRAGGRRRVHLPPYPFESRRYWVEKNRQPAAPSMTARRKPLEDWPYVVSWYQSEPVSLLSGAGKEGPWLIFLDGCGLGRELASRLRQQGAEVRTVEAGERYEQVGDGVFRLDMAEPEDYRKLAAELDAAGWPHKIVHLLTFTAENLGYDPRELERRGFYSLLFLSQALARHEERIPTIDLSVVSNRAHDVMGGERVEPEKAMILGAMKVISQELPFLRCHSIDFGELRAGWTVRSPVELLAQELVCGSEEMAVAYRGSNRWVRSFKRIRFPAAPGSLLKPGGTYLIIGGLGRLGLTTARYLVNRAEAKLALLARSALPPRGEWQEWLELHAPDDGTSQRIRAVLELEESGADVLVLSADMTDREAMARAVEEVRARFGRIDGVIHSAGAFGLELLLQKRLSDVDRILAPKVEGARVLSELFRHEDIDFLLLYSSYASVVGGLGMVDYSAANHFLDTLALAHAHGGGPRTISLAWAGWEITEELKAALRSGEVSERAQKQHEEGIRPEEAVEILDRVLGHPLPHVLISPRDLFAELTVVEEMRQEQEAPHPGTRDSRPALHAAFVAPRDDLEEAVATIWQDLLGIDRIGVHDNFYELGGHSLLAIRIASRLSDRFAVEVPLDRMMSAPTVAELAAVVAAQQAAQVDETKLAEMMMEIQDLSEEEARQLLDVEISEETVKEEAHVDG